MPDASHITHQYFPGFLAITTPPFGWHLKQLRPLPLERVASSFGEQTTAPLSS